MTDTHSTPEDVFDKLFQPPPVREMHTAMAAILLPYVRFTDRNAPAIAFTPEFKAVTALHRILLVLLAAKALQSLGYAGFESLSPADIERLTSIKGGTVRPILRRLFDERLISEPRRGGYAILTFKQLRAVCAKLKAQS